MIGAGLYANEFGGASLTGIGEHIIPECLAKEVCKYLENDMTAQEAATKSIKKMDEKNKKLIGMIIIDNDGNIGVDYNSPRMGHAYVEENESIVIGGIGANDICFKLK